MNRLVFRASLASFCLLLVAGCGDTEPKVADTKDQFGAAADAPNFAVVLNAGQRKTLGDTALGIKAALPEQSRQKAEDIAAGFARAPCGKLCGF